MDYKGRAIYRTGQDGKPLTEDYPIYLYMDGQQEGMEYLDSQISLLNNIIHSILYKIHQKEMGTEKGLELLWKAQGLLQAIQTDLAWHSDGEPREREMGNGTKEEVYLMEAYYLRNSGFKDYTHTALMELLEKVRNS